MRTTIIAALLLASCNRSDPPAVPQANDDIAGDSASWDLQSSGEGAALAITDSTGATAMRLFCPAGAGTLLVNVPAFTPIASEERLSFGQGGEATALVADPSGDPRRSGVSGEAAVPANLAALLSGPVSASYGAQSSGPHPAPPAALVAAFVGACSEDKSDKDEVPAPPVAAGTHACLIQDGKPVPANAIRAIGTEPFWGARVQGRCVTYSHPEDQSGTRVWTKFSGEAANGTWSGSLGGKPFVMRTRPQANCSDGMSDNVYPIAVALTVGGEQRTGCAEPL